MRSKEVFWMQLCMIAVLCMPILVVGTCTKTMHSIGKNIRLAEFQRITETQDNLKCLWKGEEQWTEFNAALETSSSLV